MLRNRNVELSRVDQKYFMFGLPDQKRDGRKLIQNMLVYLLNALHKLVEVIPSSTIEANAT
jgi:hypothetical protein